MNRFNICLLLTLDLEGESNPSRLEKDYQNSIKTVISYLYSHPKLCVSVCLSGTWLNYAQKKHREVFQVLNEMASRKQIEIIGSGFYNPIFPILPPVDRTGQIEKMTSALRNTIGKRPYGVSIFGSIWNQSIISTLNSCGMDYAFLDSTLIPRKYLNCLPVITSELGKSLKIMPVYQILKPQAEETGPDYVRRIDKYVKDHNDRTRISSDLNDNVITLKFTFSEFGQFLNSSCYEYIQELMASQAGNAVLTLPSLHLKKTSSFTQCYIPAGMEWNIAQWSSNSFVATENKSHFPLTIYDYLNTYQQNKKLYERMNYISMLVSQCKGGDKIRKQNAIEMLWKAQGGFNYVQAYGLPAVASVRQEAYRDLNEAERLLRDANKEKIITGSITSYDYNTDGLDEYICQMEKYHAVITKTGGMVSELDIIKNGHNYAANLSRIESFDGITDNYERGLFVEHLIEPEQFDNYKDTGTVTSPVFSKIIFDEKKFESKRHEIYLEGKAEYSSLKLPVSLRKNYVISPFGITVQYIIKNESPIELNGIFAVELNFAQTDFSEEAKTNGQFSSEMIINNNRTQIKQEKFNADDGLEFIQLTDNSEKLQFVIEPNELSGLNTMNHVFSRPVAPDCIEETSRTFCTTLYWNIKLSPGMEKEKTINLTMISIKKPKK